MRDGGKSDTEYFPSTNPKFLSSGDCKDTSDDEWVHRSDFAAVEADNVFARRMDSLEKDLKRLARFIHPSLTGFLLPPALILPELNQYGGTIIHYAENLVKEPKALLLSLQTIFMGRGSKCMTICNLLPHCVWI